MAYNIPLDKRFIIEIAVLCVGIVLMIFLVAMLFGAL